MVYPVSCDIRVIGLVPFVPPVLVTRSWIHLVTWRGSSLIYGGRIRRPQFCLSSRWYRPNATWKLRWIFYPWDCLCRLLKGSDESWGIFWRKVFHGKIKGFLSHISQLLNGDSPSSGKIVNSAFLSFRHHGDFILPIPIARFYRLSGLCRDSGYFLGFCSCLFSLSLFLWNFFRR